MSNRKLKTYNRKSDRGRRTQLGYQHNTVVHKSRFKMEKEQQWSLILLHFFTTLCLPCYHSCIKIVHGAPHHHSLSLDTTIKVTYFSESSAIPNNKSYSQCIKLPTVARCSYRVSQKWI